MHGGKVIGCMEEKYNWLNGGKVLVYRRKGSWLNGGKVLGCIEERYLDA